MELIIHHWDTDGIASAVLLTKQLKKEFGYFTPTAGNYFLSSEEKRVISDMNPEKIYLVDMSLPEKDLLFLNDLADFEVFDHHTGQKIEGIELHNPIIEGADSMEYPSCTTVLKDYFDFEENLLYWAGVWGDVGFKLDKEHPLFLSLRKFLNKEKIDFKDFKSLVTIIDCQYKTGDKNKVYETIDFLSNNPPRDIILVQKFSSVIKELEEVKSREFEKFENFGKVEFLRLKTPYYIISDMCRLKYKETPDKYNIVIGERKDFYNFYLRTGIENLNNLVKITKQNGFLGGGKNDVLGVVIPKESFDKFIDFISENFFENKGIDLVKIIDKYEEKK